MRVPPTATPRDIITAYWPYVLTLFVSFAGTLILYHLCMVSTDGRFVYVIDDAYIHMSMAKNIALYGIWGNTRFGFSACSSSPAWTLLCAACFKLTGIREHIPLLLNAVFAVILIVVLYRALQNLFPKQIRLQLPSLFLVVAAAPVPALLFTGMEHTLQILLDLLFFFSFHHAFTSGRTPEKRTVTVIILLSAAITFVRFEGLFIIVVAVLLLLGSGKWKLATAVIVAGAIPVIGNGLFSILHGWPFLPSSILLKGTVPDVATLHALGDFFTRLFTKVLFNLSRVPQVVVLLTGSLGLLALRGMKRLRFREGTGSLLLLYSGVTVMHCAFADVRWFYRYEAYLVVTGLYTVIAAAAQLHPLYIERKQIRPLLITISFIFCLPFAWRAAGSLRRVPPASRDVYLQQYQMGRFFKSCYPDNAVAVNDIGAVSFFSSSPVLDMWGLGSLEVLHARRKNTWNMRFLEQLAAEDSVKVAAVYSWLPVPASWHKAGAWNSAKKVLCCGSTVTFYAVRPDELPRLKEQLVDFAPNLPSGVQSTIF